MARKRAPQKRPRKIMHKGVCFFCEKNSVPDYKNYKDLRQFLSDRAKILGKNRTGVCSKHQRKLGAAIKRARHLGLLPFSPSI